MSEHKTTWTDMPRAAQVMLYVYGTLARLKQKGLIEGGNYETTIEGQLAFDAMQESGWTPTKAEIKSAMNFIKSGSAPPTLTR